MAKFKPTVGQPLPTFGFRTTRENTTDLVRRTLGDCFDTSTTLTPTERVNIRKFLSLLSKTQIAFPDATVSLVDLTPTRATLVIWHPVGCPTGSSPMLTVPTAGPFKRCLEALGMEARLGGHKRIGPGTERKTVVIPKQRFELQAQRSGH